MDVLGKVPLQSTVLGTISVFSKIHLAILNIITIKSVQYVDVRH